MVFAKILKEIINKNNIKNLLDYGSGKGERYFKSSEFGNETYPPLEKYWNINPTLYDPGVPHPKPVEGKFDIVISIDVLEHIEPTCISNVLDNINQLSSKYVWLRIDTLPARKRLPDGRNAHLIIEQPSYWLSLIDKHIQGKVVYNMFGKKQKLDIAIEK